MTKCRCEERMVLDKVILSFCDICFIQERKVKQKLVNILLSINKKKRDELYYQQEGDVFIQRIYSYPCEKTQMKRKCL